MVWSHSLSTCRVEFAAWGRGFVVVGLNSSLLGWVESAAVGLGWIRRSWVGCSPVFTGLGWFRRHRVGFTAVVLGIRRGWVHLLSLGWIGRVELDWPR